MALLVSVARQGSIMNWLRQALDRSRNLQPLVEPARKILWNANRDRALRGVDYQGRPYAPLKESTLKDRARKGYPPGPPLVRQGENARVIQGCVVNVNVRDGQLRFMKSWVDPWMEAHINGTATMPRRDPAGWGEEELLELRAMMPRHVLGRPR
jgi:hypothetical protein